MWFFKTKNLVNCLLTGHFRGYFSSSWLAFPTDRYTINFKVIPSPRHQIFHYGIRRLIWVLFANIQK